MKKFTPHAIFIFCLLTAFISCQKLDMKNSPFGMNTSSLSSKTNSDIYANASFTPNDDDSVEAMTVLGNQLPNPYLIPNMRQAYLNLGYDPNRAIVNNLYVRFLPSVSQLAALDSIMDSQGYELFDTPMDYEVISEGDYYQDPSIPDSLPTWQYAVVAPNFVAPSGMNYQVLAQIHIPPDDFTAVETEAENIAGGGGAQLQQNNVNPNVLQCEPGYHWDYNLKRCVPNLCEDGYHWDNTQQKCVPNTCPPGYYWDDLDGYCAAYNTNPPPPAPDAAVPAGYIKVHDINLNSDLPVRKARIVAKRWFKIDRVYTDNNGHFVSNKKFKHKVKVIVKFKNEDASIRSMRGVRLWQVLFPVKKTVGIFSGDKSNILYVAKLTQTFAYVFGQQKDVTASNKSTRYWAAATVLNAVQEYRDYATTENIGLPPTGLKILLSNYGQGSASTPLYAKRASSELSQIFFDYFLGSYPPPFQQIYATLKYQIDILASYNYGGYYDFYSDVLKETFYHELTHAAHYVKLGNSWYNQLVEAEQYEINFGNPAPYGAGNDPFSPIIALGEGWAYYMGHYLADKTYGVKASCQSEQTDASGYGISFCPGGNNHPHQLVEENFDPNLSSDHFKWIPQGLFYDLYDPANETIANFNPVNDYVSGYTNQQLFNSFSSSITTLQDFRTRLLQTTTNPTSSQVIGLFSQYHY